MATVKSFDVKNDGTGLDYFIGPKDETHKTDIPASHHAGYIACVIGAAHGTKMAIGEVERVCAQDGSSWSY